MPREFAQVSSEKEGNSKVETPGARPGVLDVKKRSGISRKIGGRIPLEDAIGVPRGNLRVPAFFTLLGFFAANAEIGHRARFETLRLDAFFAAVANAERTVGNARKGLFDLE